jgi:hypothetical protein
MPRRSKKFYIGESPFEYLRIKDRLNLGRYTKITARDIEEERILLRLGLKRIREAETRDFKCLGKRRWKVKV